MAVGPQFALRGPHSTPSVTLSYWIHPVAEPDRCASAAIRPAIPRLAVTEPKDLDEWSLAGLTREQGLARWQRVFAGKPPASRMSVSTCWGWLTWEPTDSDTSHLARLAGRTPQPVLTQIAVRDPETRTRRLSPSRRPTQSQAAPGAH